MKVSGRKIGRDHGELLHHVVLAVADRREVEIGRAGEQVAVGVDQVADPDQVVVDVAEVVALVELQAGELGDLVDRAGEQVALRGDDLAHRHELALEREQPLELLLGRGCRASAASSSSISSSISASSGKKLSVSASSTR